MINSTTMKIVSKDIKMSIFISYKSSFFSEIYAVTVRSIL